MTGPSAHLCCRSDAVTVPLGNRRGTTVVIVLAQTKGGVGKSTLAVNLAVERAHAGRDVLLVDADEQDTASDFTALRTELFGAPGYTAVALTGPAVRTQVLQMRPKYDDVIVDASGRDTAGLRAALTVADVALVPFQPRSFDLWALDKISALIAEARGYRDTPLRAVAVLNLADPAGGDNAAAAAALTGNEVIAYLDAPIGRRKAFPNSAAEGRGVCELRRQDPKASAEVTALVRAVFNSI
jgi:chromosome partitioning protein